jgi:competence protein ComEC
VGQGDCTLIKTNRNKTILIDSGEGTSSKADKGKNVIYPYLLDRGIKQIDYLILSHFDSDHAGGSIYLLENLDVKNIIIGIQNEDSYLYRKIIELVNEKNINLIVIDNPKILKIDDVYFDFIWPIKNKLILENKLNNNSLVFRVIYKDIKIMFTGDIEIPAEKEIVNVYKNTGKCNKNRLSSDILKIAHHGSDTSTTIEYLELVNPQIALIGVGKNNSFNHPSEDVIERLLEKKIKIYRTDLDRRNNYKIHKW